MKTHEELCIQAEHRARLWADGKQEQLTNRNKWPDNHLIQELFSFELWNAYQAGYKSGYELRCSEEQKGE